MVCSWISCKQPAVGINCRLCLAAWREAQNPRRLFRHLCGVKIAAKRHPLLFFGTLGLATKNEKQLTRLGTHQRLIFSKKFGSNMKLPRFPSNKVLLMVIFYGFYTTSLYSLRRYWPKRRTVEVGKSKVPPTVLPSRACDLARSWAQISAALAANRKNRNSGTATSPHCLKWS